MWILYTILSICLGITYSIETYNMADYCGNLIEMSDEYFGRLSTAGDYTGDCNVTLVTRFNFNKISFYFETFDLGKRHIDCRDTFITVYDGQNPDDAPVVNGVEKRCGQKKPHATFESSDRFLTFRYFNNDTSTLTKSMDIIFTAFHKGYCYRYEYECSNGRCIDDSVNCNGFDPCGDGSDCRLSTGAVIGIVLGSLFGVCVFTALTCVAIRNRKRQKNMIDGYTSVIQPATQEEAPIVDVSHSATVRAATPVPSYGISHQYSTTASYNVPTGIQSDT